MTDLWTRLAAHRAATEDRTIAALFEADPDRAARFSTTADGLLFDWSKTTLDDEAVRLRRDKTNFLADFWAALQQDPALFDDALRRNVVLASPSTTMALLRTVAVTWQHDTVERNAEEVLLLGRQLHERLATTAGHLDQMGRQLTRTVESYNQLVGGLESRVLVSARRFTDLGLPGEELPHAPGVTAAARPLTAPELTARTDRPNE